MKIGNLQKIFIAISLIVLIICAIILELYFLVIIFIGIALIYFSCMKKIKE